jgi:cystathionine beta-lyase
VATHQHIDATIEELRERGSLKWTFYPGDVLAAWVAEMDFGLAPPIAEALHAAVDRGDTGYHTPQAVAAVGEAAAAFWEGRFGWRVNPDAVLAAPDVVEGIKRAIEHLTVPDSPVILHTPVYYPFFSMVERAGRRLIDVPCRPDARGRYRLDLESIDRAFREGAGSLVLCNPWNPTGRSLTAEELEEVIVIAATHGGRVITDEVHAGLTYSGSAHIPAASIDPLTVITVTSASKAWNLPGLKCAQVVLTNQQDLARWNEYFTPEKVGVSTFGLIANAAAYAAGGRWLDETMERLESNRALLGELLAAHLPELTYFPPEATYLAWLDFAPYRIADPAAFLLDAARVALAEGRPFGGTGYARLNFATPPAILEKIVTRIAARVAR